MVTSSVTAVLIVHSFRPISARLGRRGPSPATSCSSLILPARDQRGGGAPGDDLLALLVLGPDLDVHEVLSLAAFLGGPLADDSAAAADDVSEPHEPREPHAELLDRAHAQPVGDRLGDEAHGEHAVGEDVTHAGGLGEGRILVDWEIGRA